MCLQERMEPSSMFSVEHIFPVFVRAPLVSSRGAQRRGIPRGYAAQLLSGKSVIRRCAMAYPTRESQGRAGARLRQDGETERGVRKG